MFTGRLEENATEAARVAAVLSGGATPVDTVDVTTLKIGGTAVTATAAELNIMDGVTATTAELNIMDGVTATAAELNIMDGVTATAAEINLIDGGVAGTVVASKAVIANSSGALADADLLLESTNEINVTIGGVSMLALDDAAIAGNAGASGTAGKACFVETQDGGTAATDTNGVAGGALSIKTGDGSIPNGSGTTGGAGGDITITGGVGAAGAATGTGGAGGDVNLVAAVGGNTSGAGTGGAGGDIAMTPGTGGTTSGGTAGADGHVKFAAAHQWLAADTGDPAFGTAKGFTGASGITAMDSWVIVKNNAGVKKAIPTWGFS